MVSWWVFFIKLFVSFKTYPLWSAADAEIKDPPPYPISAPLGGNPGLGCTTTSQTNPPARLHMSGANWRPWHLQLKLSVSQKVAVARQKLSPNLGRQCIWAELHETGGLPASLAVNRLGRCRATRHRFLSLEWVRK